MDSENEELPSIEKADDFHDFDDSAIDDDRFEDQEFSDSESDFGPDDPHLMLAKEQAKEEIDLLVQYAETSDLQKHQRQLVHNEILNKPDNVMGLLGFDHLISDQIEESESESGDDDPLSEIVVSVVNNQVHSKVHTIKTKEGLLTAIREHGEHTKINQAENADNVTIVCQYFGDDRITSDVLSKFEVARVIAVRVNQIEKTGKHFILEGTYQSAIEIALNEVRQRRCPLKIHRRLNDTEEEVWKVNEMILPPSLDDWF